MLKKIPFKTVETPNDDARIVRSAIQYDDVVYTHVRHSYALWAIKDLNIFDRLTCGSGIQGFVDQFGNFHDRTVSAKIAFKAKQISKEQNELFSEDIWYNDGSQMYQGE